MAAYLYYNCSKLVFAGISVLTVKIENKKNEVEKNGRTEKCQINIYQEFCFNIELILFSSVVLSKFEI